LAPTTGLDEMARRIALADWLALALALASVISSLLIAGRVFENLPHVEDEFAYLWQATVMADSQLTVPSPAEPRYFVIPFVVDEAGQRFGKYPPGWPAALSLGIRLGTPQLINAVLAGACVWHSYRLGQRLSSRGVGLLAGLLVATSPMFLMLSGSLMSHLFSLFLSLSFTLSWVHLFLSGEADAGPVPLLVAASALGMLAVTRPLTALGVALPCALHAATMLRRGPPNVRLRLLAIASLSAAVALLVPLWQYAVTGDPMTNPYTLWWEYDRLGFGPEIGPQAGGHSLHWAYVNTRFSLWVMQTDLFGWPSLSLLLVPFGVWALRRESGMWLSVAVLPSLVLCYSLYWVGAWLYGPRYYFEALPALAVASAAGVVWLARHAQRLGGAGRRGVGTAIVAALLLMLVGANVAYYLPMRLAGMRGLNGASRSAQQGLLSAEGLPGTLVLVNPTRSWVDAAVLMLLAPPFDERGFLVAWDRDSSADQRLREQYPGHTVMHYYPDLPGILRPDRR
jgi:hypothetical protein